ncbi:MAG: hypothetical protein U5M23_01945 [Marinagarivorans sp.]|nr:hypothetical protein [Marinagarivorans sp.]
MLNYQTIDAIADAYIPTLLVVTALSMAIHFKNPHTLLTSICKLALLMLLPYGLMLADQALHLWQKLHWDYSTHTAVAATCCWYLFWLGKGTVLASRIFHSRFIYSLWPLSLAAYLTLMDYQNYHSWQDMLSTLVALAPLLLMHKAASR